MLQKLFGDTTFLATSGALDAAALRHEALANNLANINTPGYKRQDVNFEESLAAALTQTNGASNEATRSAVANLKPQVITVASTSERPDGNNVDPEAENIAVGKNMLRYEMLAQSMGGSFAALKMVINGR
jgi:flagellar basal-body rod protein FlgB